MSKDITPEYFVEQCKKNDVTIERISGTVITLTKSFPAGDKLAYADVESDTSIIYSVPMTSAGSTWGTTGDTVGGWAAVNSGCMRINRSGCSKRFLKAVSKLIAKN